MEGSMDIEAISIGYKGIVKSKAYKGLKLMINAVTMMTGSSDF